MDNFHYWFGNLGSLSSNYFGQTDSVAYTSGDSAMAFSWQSVPIPPHTSVCASVLVVFDTSTPYNISLNLTVYPFPDPAYPGDVISVSGYVANFPFNGGISIEFWVTVDGNIATLTSLGVSRYTWERLHFSFTIADCPLTNGLHELSIYAVSKYLADISPPFNISLNVLGMTSGGGANQANVKKAWTWTAEYSNPTAVGISVTIVLMIIILVGVCGIAFWFRQKASADA
jgi:hypothetical protein